MMRIRSSTRRMLIRGLTPAWLIACLLLGGASAAGLFANLALQLGAVALIAIALLVHAHTPPAQSGRQLLALAGLLILLLLVQLIPLPPAIWTALPGRGAVADGFRLLGTPLPWLPLSLTPAKTVASALWLLPAFAALLLILRTGAYRARWIAIAIVAVAIISVGIGAVQLGGGSQSPAYFYRITNFGAAVGFFSNANHFATLLLVTLPFLAALLADTRDRSRTSQRRSAGNVMIATAILVVVIGIVISGSLAGLGLGLPVVGASAALVWLRGQKVPRWVLPLVALAAVAAVAGVLSQPFGNNLTGADARVNADSRYTSFSRSLAAAGEYFPVGSGTGSFLDVYRQQEDPARVTRTFMNHVHSDPIEILLENGVVGAALMLLVLAWWARRSWLIWRADKRDLYARAATIAVGAIMAHGLVDYPLRTAGIATVFAICLALMANPRERDYARRRQGDEESAARHVVA